MSGAGFQAAAWRCTSVLPPPATIGISLDVGGKENLVNLALRPYCARQLAESMLEELAALERGEPPVNAPRSRVPPEDAAIYEAAQEAGATHQVLMAILKATLAKHGLPYLDSSWAATFPGEAQS